MTANADPVRAGLPASSLHQPQRLPDSPPATDRRPFPSCVCGRLFAALSDFAFLSQVDLHVEYYVSVSSMGPSNDSALVIFSFSMFYL